MMDSATFYWCNKQEYQKRLFPTQQEYNRIENIYLPCKTILHGNLQYMHPKTIKFRDVYKHEILDNICELPGPREKFGRLLPMEQIRNNTEFQKKFHEHNDFLMNIASDNYWRPVEEMLSQWEILFVLYNHPEMAKHIYHQTYSMQEILATRAPQYLKQPNKHLAEIMNPDQVQSVPFDVRDINFEALAVIHDKLPIQDIHYDQLPEFVQTDMTEILLNAQIKKLAIEIEKLGVPVFGENTMEKMRLAFIDKYEWQCAPNKDGFFLMTLLKPILAYMRNPSKRVKETSVRKNPYTICGIRYQYDAIQELALRVMAEKRREHFEQHPSQPAYNNPWNFQYLRLMLVKPSAKIEKLYMGTVQHQR